jgi:hypothetical protein
MAINWCGSASLCPFLCPRKKKEKTMKRMKHVLVTLLIIGVASFTMANMCEDAAEKACGPCGTIETGDSTISGNVELDGLFKAVNALETRVSSVKTDFDSRVKALANAVGVAEVEGKTTEELVTAVKAEFAASGSIGAQLEGGIVAKYEPPKCSADISVAVEAQAKCEAKAGCDVDAKVTCDPGELSFACEGECTGSCDATCSGSCTVAVEGGVTCEGECRGSCEMSVAASCEGTCRGTCSGACSATDAQGDCAGACEGNCEGSCELEAGASCEGTCHGECTVELEAEATCEGKCEGSCSGGCTGECNGNFEPPSCDAEASASCEAQADCEAQASAQASATLNCNPPSLTVDYAFKASADAAAKAEVVAKLEKFKVEMVNVIKGNAEIVALVDPQDGVAATVILPAVQDLATSVASGDFEVTAIALLPCAVSALDDSVDILTSISGDMAATIEAQVDLIALVN